MWGASTRPFPTRHAKHPGLEPRLPEWHEYLGLIHRRIAKIPYIHLPGHIRFEPFASKRDAVLMWLNAFFTSPLIIYECQKCDRSNIRGRQPWKPRISLNNGATCRR